MGWLFLGSGPKSGGQDGHMVQSRFLPRWGLGMADTQAGWLRPSVLPEYGMTQRSICYERDPKPQLPGLIWSPCFRNLKLFMESLKASYSHYNRILHFHWTLIKTWHLGRKELTLGEVCCFHLSLTITQ